MSTPSLSAIQPRIPDSDFHSPYFDQVMSTIGHCRILEKHLKHLQELEQCISVAKDGVSDIEGRMRSAEHMRTKRIEDLAKTQQKQFASLRRHQAFLDSLSRTEIQLEELKADASCDSIAIDQAVVNAPVEEKNDIGTSKNGVSLSKRLSTFYGIKTLVLRMRRDDAKAAIFHSENFRSDLARHLEAIQGLVDMINVAEVSGLDLLAQSRQFLEDTEAERRQSRSLADFEEECLSRSVVDLVLEWKRNKKED